MQLPIARCQALDGGDAAPGALQRQPVAGFDRLAVDQHRAGAALCRVATLVRAGELQLLAQDIHQQ